MSKKYVIEIKPEYENTTKGVMVLGARGSDLYVDALSIENLEELNSDYINENFGDLQDEAYKRGFEDGKGAINKGCEGCQFEGTDIYFLPCGACRNAYPNQWTAKKQDDEIKVGDEVIYNGTTKCIVVLPEDDERYASLIDSDGIHYYADHRECKKTGRHYDIEKILEEMKG